MDYSFLKKLSRPERICWLIIPLLCILLFFVNDETWDIQLHDTYLVVAKKQLILVGIGSAIIAGLLYRFLETQKRTSPVWLTLFHALFSFFLFVTLIVLLVFFIKNERDYFEEFNWLVGTIAMACLFAFVNIGLALILLLSSVFFKTFRLV